MFFVSKNGHIIHVQVKDIGIFQDENEVKKSLEDDINEWWFDGYWTETIDTMAKTGESWLFSLKKDIGWSRAVENHYNHAAVALTIIM